MSNRDGYRFEPFSANRQVVSASVAVSRESDTIHLVTEADITEPRRLMAEHRERTGERLSLTAFVTACLGRTVDEFRGFNSFRRGRRLVLLDDVTIGVLMEREIGGERVPEPVCIQGADRKAFRRINDELREAQGRPSRHLGTLSGMGWVRFIPGFLLRTFVRLAARSIGMKKRFGVVGVTAIGMFGPGPLWLLPITSATVTAAIGGIVRRPAVIEGLLREREHLCLTLSFDHAVVDGAPAARFAGRLAELLAGGELLREELAGGER